MPALSTPVAKTDPRGPVLASYELCRSVKFDAFRDSLNSVFYPARVEPNSTTEQPLDSLLCATALRHLTVGYVRFGVDTSVDPGSIGYYHVSVPLSGAVETHCGKQQVVAVPDLAAVMTPREHTYMPHWSEDAGQLCVKINRRTLEEELERLLGTPVTSWVRFEIGFDVATGAGARWLNSLQVLLAEVDAPDSLLHRSPHHREHLERMLIAGLVLGQQHNYSEQLRADATPARPRTVKRVIDAIQEDPGENWPLSVMASRAGVSARRLQQGFRDHIGLSPTEYLRKVRLERARNDLLNGASTVADVAHRWGFHHPGRFAQLYREYFGEFPSVTTRHVWPPA